MRDVFARTTKADEDDGTAFEFDFVGSRLRAGRGAGERRAREETSRPRRAAEGDKARGGHPNGEAAAGRTTRQSLMVVYFWHVKLRPRDTKRQHVVSNTPSFHQTIEAM